MKPYIAVAGGVNIDIGGRSTAPLLAADSNPGIIRSALGGVGRNIAHNLALLGTEVKLVTALGGDDSALRVERSCRELGIDLSAALRVPDAATGTYLYIDDADGDMALAVNDMAILDQLTPEFFSGVLDVLNGAALLVIDANLPADSIIYLAQHCTVPIFADPVSVAKGSRLKSVLHRIHTLKPNRPEAEMLTGIPIRSEADLFAAADALLESGVRQVFLSLGADGVLAADQSHRLRIGNPPADMKNATGCGDAFMAALAIAALENAEPEHAARMGLAAAAIAMESEATINPAMSREAINARLETF